MLKFIKKAFTIIISISMMCLILSKNNSFYADPPTERYFVDLNAGDILFQDELLKYDVTGTTDITIYVYFDSDPATPPISSTSNCMDVDWNYLVSDIDQANKTMILVPEATLRVNQNDVFTISYLVPILSCFEINVATNTIVVDGFVSYDVSTTINPGENCIWEWKTDFVDYSSYQEYTDVVSTVQIKDLCGSNYIVDINYTTYIPTLTSIAIMGNNSAEINSSNTYNINLMDQHGKVMSDTSKTITASRITSLSDDTVIDGPYNITYSDGYSFTIIAPPTPGDIFYKFTCDGVDKYIYIIVEGLESDSPLENNSWPWADSFASNNVKLKTELKGAPYSVTYQWQESNQNLSASFTDIAGVTGQVGTISSPTSGTWYRCKITYQQNNGDPDEVVYTKAVQILNKNNIDYYACSTIMSDYYISNGLGAYAYNKTNGQFNILGLWNDKWISTAYDSSWSIYMKEVGSDTLYPTAKPLTNIKDMMPRFSNYNNSNVTFDVRFNDACDAAIFTDVALGSSYIFDYSDSAAVKANLSGSSLSNIQLFASPTFADASSDTCAFVLTPITRSIYDGSSINNVSTFTIDAYDNTDEFGDPSIQYDCEDDVYDEAGGDYAGELEIMSELIFNYCTGPRPDYITYYADDNPFILKNIGGVNACVGLYDTDSILAMSWANTTEISYMFGIGKASEMDGVTFNDIADNGGGGGGSGHSGHYSTPIPNTSIALYN